MKVTPETLRASQDIRDMLWSFDFALTSNKEFGPVRFDTVPLQPFEIVAQRGSGCVYALTGRCVMSCWRHRKGRRASWRRPLQMAMT